MLLFLCVSLFLGAAFGVAWFLNRNAWATGDVAVPSNLDRVQA